MRSSEDNVHYDEPLNSTTGRLLKRLVHQLEVERDTRVRRSHPTSLFSASSMTLLKLLERFMQDSLLKECSSNHSVCPGKKGEQGETGGQGVSGKQGPRGEEGMKGEKGDVGAEGKKGDTGETGKTVMWERRGP